MRWTLPSCPLHYELLTKEELEGSFGLESFLAIEATTKDDRLELRVASTMWMLTGQHRPFAVPDKGFDPLVLKTDGIRWSPVGQSILFASLGTQGGLGWMFPPIPEGAQRSWDYPMAERTLGHNGVSMLQSDGAAQIGVGRVLGWPLRQEAEISREGNLVLRARGPERWSSQAAPGEQVLAGLERDGELRSEHVILPSGRLLRATLQRETTLLLTVNMTTPPRTMRSRFRQRSEVHLVSACDGPTASKLEPALTREERAIATLGELSLAVYGVAPRESASALFSAALRAARGDAKILATIDRHRKAHGERSWPTAFLVDDADVVVKGSRIEISATASVPRRGDKNVSTPATFRFEMVEEGGRFVIDRVTASLAIEPGNPQIFELSTQRARP